MDGIEHVLILGAGHAGAQAADVLRRTGFEGSIVLVGDEPLLPYERPPLSKKYLAGALARERLLIRSPQFYCDHAIEARIGRRAEEIDRRLQRVRLDDGSHQPYDVLLFATGSRPRPLVVPGATLAGVHYLRTLSDVDRLRPALARGRRIVIVGGGYIGLEVAATCHEIGLAVTVLEMAERLMSRVVCPEISAFYEAEHVRRGVRIVCNARVSNLAAAEGSERVGAALCEDGTEHPADLVLVGVGVEAADELARRGGIECSNGISVNPQCRTSDAHIYAAGDCTSHPSHRYGRRVRLESVDNAFEQATSAALNINGRPTVHDKVPWFWSDQFDLRLVIVGLGDGHDATILRGNLERRSFSVCYLRDRELIAVDCVNSPKDQMVARKLIAARLRPNMDRLVDPNVPLKDCA